MRLFCCRPTESLGSASDDWQHEIKFDGFRVQIHKLGNEVEFYSRSGSRFSRRFPRLAEVLRQLPARSAIIDGEVVASDAVGMPDFWPLFLRAQRSLPSSASGHLICWPSTVRTCGDGHSKHARAGSKPS